MTNTTNIIPAAPLRRHLNRLISDARADAYGRSKPFYDGEIIALSEALDLTPDTGVDPVQAIAVCEAFDTGAPDTPIGRGASNAWCYLRNLFKDFVGGGVWARSVLTDLG